MPVVRKHSTVAERVQALTLHAVRRSHKEIEAITGIKSDAFKQLLRRAKKRGYVVGDKIEEAFVLNGEKTGRPKVIGPLESRVIEEVLTKDFASRCSTAGEISDLVA
jgi:hypothetical protein